MWRLQPKFMHNPSRLDPIWSSVTVKHQRLSHPYNLTCCRIMNRPIFSGGFPVPRPGRAIRPKPRSVFSISEAEEIPLFRVQLCHLLGRMK